MQTIVILGRYPRPENERDGMVQRIKAVDALFSACRRCYVDMRMSYSPIPSWRTAGSNVRVYRLNAFLHLPILLWLLVRAKIVYVHSLLAVSSHSWIPLLRPTILDLHGAVPEEARYNGQPELAAFYDRLERVLVERCKLVVVVSNAMLQHLRAKYRASSLRGITMPLFDSLRLQHGRERHSDGRFQIIYAGGIDRWQNIDLMVECIRRLGQSWKCTILSGSPEVFRDRLQNVSNVEIGSVPKEEVYKYYLRSDFGFLLRDSSVVNKVACPTKLLEYLACGVVPVVLQPEIGDFHQRGYSYVLMEDILAGRIPDSLEIARMRENNYRVLEQIGNESAVSAEALRAMAVGAASTSSTASRQVRVADSAGSRIGPC